MNAQRYLLALDIRFRLLKAREHGKAAFMHELNRLVEDGLCEFEVDHVGRPHYVFPDDIRDIVVHALTTAVVIG